eukprot:CAMPEP_0170630792 /NCGR_PEP_ID=MMETSP0224-20130122/34224_1 /TAXON_ID=285029 /ORGANISM="Togula jolla, Strain CCCM 725" /LENGTH=315 /DNA_ID=CAMNT_0010958943 /DNA_START=69 /DNA_END=1013 /DNA_ORIENTATION=-
MAPRIVFKVMQGSENLGLRALRREFGTFGEVFCAALWVDSHRQPDCVEIEFVEPRTTMRLRTWDGKTTNLPLYCPEGLVDAVRRDASTSFLCYVENFGQAANTFQDLTAFASFVTDTCSATIRGASLCWAPGRGVYAQLVCNQRVDQERIMKKVMADLYRGQKLSCSSMMGGEQAGEHRIDWATVGSTIQAQSDRLRKAEEAKDAKRKAKKAKKEKVHGALSGKTRGEKKSKKDKKKMKKAKLSKTKDDKDTKSKCKKRQKRQRSKSKAKDQDSSEDSRSSVPSPSSCHSGLKLKREHLAPSKFSRCDRRAPMAL